MKRSAWISAVVALGVVAACNVEYPPPHNGKPGDIHVIGGSGGGGGDSRGDAGTADAGVLPDGGSPSTALPGSTTEASLITFLQGGSYLTWASESSVHASNSSGIHGTRVKVYVNPTLRDAMKGNVLTHPTGSIAVVEEYDVDSTTVIGQALWYRSSSGDLWFQAEFPNYTGASYFQGTANTCFACHQGAGGSTLIWTSESAFP